MSHTLSASGVYMGEPLNVSGDLLPPEKMYDACRVFAQYVKYKGNMEWDFSEALKTEPTAEFKDLVYGYLSSVLKSPAENKGWKIPETTLVYPWILKMFPDIRYIYWVRDPRDCILSSHLTDDLHKFGIDYEETEDIRLKRAISWKYQREIVQATPEPEYTIKVRFEDMVFSQKETLEHIGKFLGINLKEIEMRPDSVGRYKTDEGAHMYDFFKSDMIECGYSF